MIPRLSAEEGSYKPCMNPKVTAALSEGDMKRIAGMAMHLPVIGRWALYACCNAEKVEPTRHRSTSSESTWTVQEPSQAAATSPEVCEEDIE